MESIEGSAAVRTRPASTSVVIDLRGLPQPSTGRGRRRRLQPAVDLILAAWFGIPAISTGGELGATPAAGRACGGNSPTKSSGRSSLGWGS